MTADDLLFISIGSAAALVAQRTTAQAAFPMRTLILDTDDATLQRIPPTTGSGISTFIFGTQRLGGRGTGGDPRMGEGALRDDLATLMAQIGSPRLVVLLTCCGGGTSAATRLLLPALREKGIATLCFATIPFAFEGEETRQNANSLLPVLENSADALARISLEALLEATPQGRSIQEDFDTIADRLASGLTLLWSLLLKPNFFAFDIERLRRLLIEGSASCLPFHFADVTATGPDRAQVIVRQLIASKRFERDGMNRLESATEILIGVLAGEDLRLSELSTLVDGVKGVCTNVKETFLGTSILPHLQDKLSVVLFAFGLPTADILEKTSATSLHYPSSRKKGKSSPLKSAADPFAEVEKTIFNGQNLDEPTYVRRGIRLAR
jgi:cell division protein FtsZ